MFGSLQFGITSLNSNLSHLESTVELDVYDTLTYGNGTYWLYNSGNTSCEIPIIFLCEARGWIGHEYESEDVTISADGTEITQYSHSGYDHIFNLTFNPNSSVCLNIHWSFQSGFETDYVTWGLDLSAERIRFYYTGYTINGGKFWNNQSINHEKVIFNFHTENFFVEENLIAMNLTDYLPDNHDFSYLERRQAYISNIEKFPVETTATGYHFTLEFAEIMENIYITIVNDNSRIVLSGMSFFLIAGAISIIVVIGIRIWKKFKK